MELGELHNLAESLGSDSSAWHHLVRHDPLRRVFEPVLDEPDVEGWLICWMPGHDTGFHDHDVSSGAVTVLSGQVLEERLTVGRGGMLASVYSAGHTFEFSPSDIHRVTHTGSEPAVTLHVYSPRIVRPGAYTVSDEGVLRRHPVESGEELRPLTAA
jgi:predicted metal-dependent enzyme (double-stranded beta helix superfamily)